MAGINLPSKAVRTQIASAVHMNLQVNRMRDGTRRVTSIPRWRDGRRHHHDQDLFTSSSRARGPTQAVCNFKSGGSARRSSAGGVFTLDKTLMEVI